MMEHVIRMGMEREVLLSGMSYSENQLDSGSTTPVEERILTNCFEQVMLRHPREGFA